MEYATRVSLFGRDRTLALAGLAAAGCWLALVFAVGSTQVPVEEIAGPGNSPPLTTTPWQVAVAGVGGTLAYVHARANRGFLVSWALAAAGLVPIRFIGDYTTQERGVVGALEAGADHALVSFEAAVADATRGVLVGFVVATLAFVLAVRVWRSPLWRTDRRSVLVGVDGNVTLVVCGTATAAGLPIVVATPFLEAGAGGAAVLRLVFWSLCLGGGATAVLAAHRGERTLAVPPAMAALVFAIVLTRPPIVHRLLPLLVFVGLATAGAAVAYRNAGVLVGGVLGFLTGSYIGPLIVGRTGPWTVDDVLLAGGLAGVLMAAVGLLGGVLGFALRQGVDGSEGGSLGAREATATGRQRRVGTDDP